MQAIMSLSKLKRKETAKVVDISGSEEVKARFYDLGIIPGTVLCTVNQSILGGPVTLECRGSKIAIRSQAASQILVQKAA